MKILISDNIPQGCVDILGELENIQVDCKVGLRPDELASIIGEYDGLVVRSATKVTEEILKHANRLRIIGRAGTGVDNIDLAEATRQGIVVMNTPGGNTVSTAEHTMSMLLALSRHIPQAMESIREGEWAKKRFVGVEIFGKTLGIIGLGNVGREVVQRARGFGMVVIGYDPYISQEVAKKIGVRLVDMAQIFEESDYITVHTPHNEETHHLISRKQLSRVKPGVRIINCARGGIIDEEALLEAIRSGKVAGAALDVFEKEPPIDNPLLDDGRVIYTPHLGASTEEAQDLVAIQIGKQMVEFFLTGTARNAVNIPPIDLDTFKELQPYLDLGEHLGKFLDQLLEGQPKRVRIEYYGEMLNFTTWPITSSILQGILRRTFVEGINLVNAQIIADERGLVVDEVRSSDPTDYMSLITVVYETDRGSQLISGTLFGKRNPRIVRIDNFEIDAIPEGDLLVCGHKDQKGMIGKVGTILGEKGINISHMSWSRNTPGGNAVMVLGLDSPALDETIEEILSQSGFNWIKKIKI